MTGTRVNDAVIAYGEALLAADDDRMGVVRALSLDETLFVREGRWRTQRWSTQMVDARNGQLLDVVAGGTAGAPARWLEDRDPRPRCRRRRRGTPTPATCTSTRTAPSTRSR